MVNKIISTAIKELGYKETPAGSNKTKYGKWYGMDGNPWCAMWVSWVFDKAGQPLPVIQKNAPSGGAYCPFFERYAKNNDQWFKYPVRGDLALFHFGRNLAVHIGIVEKVLSKGKFLCLEGNTSVSSNDNGGSVMRRTRRVSQCRGFYRPTFSQQLKGKEAYYRIIRLSQPLMMGNDIKEWQKQMNFFPQFGGLEEDGYYGVKSEAVCRAFQENRKLEVDGIIGVNTWRESFKELSK